MTENPKRMSNEELIQELLYRYQEYQDYNHRIDEVYWTQEAEDMKWTQYKVIKDEMLRRMGEDVD